MATSTLKFYKVEFELEENPRIDDLSAYLNSVQDKITINDFQYIRHNLNVSIKIDLSQDDVDEFDYNYVEIYNNNDLQKFYYYITSSKQSAPQTIQLELQMDTINSIIDPRQFTNKTEIFRQHMDRFIKPSSFNPSASSNTLLRKIDTESEGIVPNKKLIYKEKAQETYGTSYTWYLVYITQNVPSPDQPYATNPIKVYLCANSRINVSHQGSDILINSINDIDKTDSKLVKIISCPYCPVNYTLTTSASFLFPYNWNVSTTSPLIGYLQYTGNEIPNFINIFAAVVPVTELSTTLTSNQIGNRINDIKSNESKLYHSDFYSNKIVYDSFAKDIKLENWIPSYDSTYQSQRIKLDFKITNTINSKFGFKLYRDIGEQKQEEDFDDILLCNRNNELTILNSEYINYIKNGYNYDKKSNALQLESARRSATVSTLASVGGIIAGIADVAVGTKVLGAGMITSGIAGLAGAGASWANVQKTQESQDNSMQSKLAQLQAQSASTSGTDDVDLMQWYSDNKVWNIKYNINELTSDRIYNLLRYTGYSHHDYNTVDVDSRIWYNYIQCDPYINKEEFGKFKFDWIQDLKEKYKKGVTVYHHNDNDWDFDKQYENYETWIVEGV